MEAEIDRIAIAKLEERYGIAKSVLYDRMNALGIKAEKIGNRSYLSGEQLQLLDGLHEHMKAGGSLAMFVERVGKQTAEQSAEQSSMVVAGQSAEQSALLKIVAAMLDRQSTAPSPFESRRQLKEVAEEGWYLFTSELLPLLGLKSIPPLDDHNRFTRMGFVFWRAGKASREYEWRVTKVQP